MSEAAAWLVLFLPLASFLIISLVIRPFFNRYSQWAGYLTILAIGGALVLSLMALKATTGHEGPIGWDPHSWITVGSFNLRLGIYMNSLTAIMLVVVSGVSLMVQVYSQGYMKGDPGYARYFAFMSLFTASMLGLVLASNVVMLYAFWELVGLCSYLLIGFWYHRPAAAAAAKKAFIVTRLGDFGFLLAILYLFFHQGAFAGQGLNSLEIPDIYRAVQTGLLGTAVLTWLGLGIFAGAVGKSAQFPLHVWLPDAMEGPTPVSALIHAATMVAAGVFLVARFFPIFEAAPATLRLVAVIGGATAVFAATMGMVMNDIKRVVAYSTISQLGYMMLALGVGAYAAAIFHLFNHAFFKALLFLGSGSANHATGTFNMRYMGGLRRYMPWTYGTFLIAALSLAGIFPLAGFWSKDEVLAEALGGGHPVSTLAFVLAVVAVPMTAFYIFRALFMTFHGEFRGGAPAEEAALAGSQHGNPHPAKAVAATGKRRKRRSRRREAAASAGHGGIHLAESPWVMVLPMLALAVLAIGSGFIANSPIPLVPVPEHWFSGFLVVPGGHAEAAPFNLAVAVGSTLLALGGISVAWLLYGARKLDPAKVTVKPLYTLLTRKYYMDDLYEKVVVGKLFYRGLCATLEWFDGTIVDGAVDGVGWLGRNLGKALARLQTGEVQAYGAGISLGLLVILIAYLVWR